MEKNNESSLDAKINDISKLSLRSMKKVLKKYDYVPLFKDRTTTEYKFLDLVGIAFVIESLILSERMRDKRLTGLEQKNVEQLAMELYLSVDKLREEEGYREMCDVSNHIPDRYLSLIEDNKKGESYGQH